MPGSKKNSEKKIWVLLLWKKKPRETYILEKQYVKYYKNKDYVSAKWGKSWWDADVIEESDNLKYLESLEISEDGKIINSMTSRETERRDILRKNRIINKCADQKIMSDNKQLIDENPIFEISLSDSENNDKQSESHSYHRDQRCTRKRSRTRSRSHGRARSRSHSRTSIRTRSRSHSRRRSHSHSRRRSHSPSSHRRHRHNHSRRHSSKRTSHRSRDRSASRHSKLIKKNNTDDKKKTDERASGSHGRSPSKKNTNNEKNSHQDCSPSTSHFDKNLKKDEDNYTCLQEKEETDVTLT